MRAIISVAAAVATGSFAASLCLAVQPTAMPYDAQAVIKATLQSDDGPPVEFRSFGPPVKAESCRLYDRSKDKWQAVEQSGIAIHVRYRTTSSHGLAVPHSRVFFINSDGAVWKTVEPSGVRSSDPKLLR